MGKSPGSPRNEDFNDKLRNKVSMPRAQGSDWEIYVPGQSLKYLAG